jgi:hypothetical protein
MNIICPRCEVTRPAILIASRVNQLCDKCGNALINVTDRIDPPPDEFNGYDAGKDKKDKKDKVEMAEFEERTEDEAINALLTDDIVETMPDLEKMSEKKLRQLGKDLDVPNYWNRHLDDLKELIQEALNEQQTG